MIRRTRLARVAGSVLAGTLAFLWGLYLVQPPEPAGTSLDQSWRIALTLAAREHLLFGRDIVFTYGPLGYALAGVPDASLAPSSVAISVLLAIVAVAGVGYALRAPAGLLRKAAACVVLVVVTTILSLDYAAFIGAFALLARAARLPRLAPAVGLAVGAVALLGVLSKYTLALDVLAAGAAVWIVDLVRGPARRRKAALVGGGIALGTIAIGLGIALSFSPSAIAAYLHGAAEIAGGYSAAMAIVGPRRGIALALAVGAAIIAVGIAAWREGKPTLFALTAITLFLAWKHGFVRQDVHVIFYFGTGAAVAAILMVVVRSTAAAILGLASTALAFGAFAFAVNAEGHGGIPLVLPGRIASGAAYLVAPVATQTRLAALEPDVLAPDRLPPNVLARVASSTVDVVPTETAIVEANALRWDPLPVFQAYSAYTPALDRLNRDALIAHGASYVFFEYSAIDERLVFGEMPATTAELLCRYRPVFERFIAVGPRSHLLLHRDAAGCDASAASEVRNVAVGRPVEVPPVHRPDELIVASIVLRPSLRTAIRTALWRAPNVYVDLRYADGAVLRRRIVAATVADGVVISPTPRNLDEAAAAFGRRPGTSVLSLTIVSPRADAYALDGVTFTRLRRRAPLAPAD